MDGRETTSEPFEWVEEYSTHDWQQQSNSSRKRKKVEFVGWGSRPLIQFLESIGRDTSQPISQFDVTSIINEYVDRNLLQPMPASYNQYSQYSIKNKPKKKKRVLCDERLRSLFGRKSISRVMIYKLLERHLAEANSEFDSDDSHGYISCGNEVEEEAAVNGKKKGSYNRNEQVSEISNSVPNPKSCFAAIIPDNIKLVYLKRSLIEVILQKDNDIVALESKIVGSFVRIKSDPNDYLQKYSHHLLQVTGIKQVTGAGNNNAKILLHASAVIKDILISDLSDEDFSEEECDELNQRIKDSNLKRLTVEELQQKVQILHEDMTKHWLAGELVLLQKLIDRANERGWRRELFEYVERLELLQTKHEQLRLLSEVPKVIAENIEPKVNPPHVTDEANHSTPGSIDERFSEAPISYASDDEFESTWAHYSSEESQPDEPVQEGKEPEKSTSKSRDVGGIQNVNAVENKTPQMVAEPQIIDLSDDGGIQNVNAVENKTPQMVAEPQIINLSDDDEENEEPVLKVETCVDMSGKPMWHYLDPQGEEQGPFSIASLKHWSDADYFPPDFRIWKTGETSTEAQYLKDILGQKFSNQLDRK